MTGPALVWLVMGLGVVAYALSGGADFGAGVLHLLARGPAKTDVRRSIEGAIAPIWEANHVWLIFTIVILFTAFPRAFAAISTALHVPIALALLGIVVRGSAFVFYSYDLRGRDRGKPWAVAFGVSSLFTPLVLGTILGALSTGDIRVVGARVTSGFFAGWTTPFALTTGAFATALFTLLASVYMTVEARGAARAWFRRTALTLEVLSGALALLVFLLAASGAPAVHHGLSRSALAIPLHAATALSAFVVCAGLLRGRYRIARAGAVVQAALVVVGWGHAMGDHIVVPDVTLENSGTRAVVVRALLPALAIGALVLAPSLWYLFRVFKAANPRADEHP